jgi:site-specific recombinase XerD
MAEVFRPTYYVDPRTGKRCTNSTPCAVKRKSKTWHARYYLPSGERKKVKLYTDRKASETRAAELERRGERLDAGFADPLDEHAKRPLAEHAEDFRRYLCAKGNTAEYVAKLLYRLTAVLDGCRFIKVGDVQSSAVVEYLGALRRQGKSTKTANDYLDAAKGFTRWLWRDKRCILDPLAGLSRLTGGEADVRHARREFSPEELALLLDTARTSARSLRNLTGTDRYFLYLTAAATGFRASELASMTPDSFDLDGNTPTATVEASCTKNKKLAVQPLPLDVAHALRDYLDGKPAGKPVWPGKWKSRAFLMVQSDLQEARGKWLESFQDARQRDEAERSDFPGLPRRCGPLCRFPRIAPFVHHDGWQGRRVPEGTSGPCPPFDLRAHVTLHAFALLRPGGRRAIATDSDRLSDRPGFATAGRDGDRWTPFFPWPKPWPANGDFGRF